MSLSRSILLRNAALLAALLLLGGGAVWGLFGQQRKVHEELVAYRYMKSVTTVIPLVNTAVEDLPAKTQEAASVLRIAAREAQSFLDLLNASGQADAYTNEAKATASRSVGKLREAASLIDRDPAAARATAAAVAGDLKRLGDLCLNFIRTTGEAADARVTTTLWIIGGIALVVFAAAVVLSVQQYRSVITPLNALQTGVRNVAAKQFTERVALASGPVEFTALADEFNRMATELDGFYHALEQKVAAKSKELVRSERLASIGFLAAGVAHEINNPLSVIAGYAELLMNRIARAQRDEPEDEAELAGVDVAADLAKCLQIIKDEAFRGKQITVKLLSLARGSEGRSHVSLSRLCHEVATLVAGLKGYRDRRLSLRFDENDVLTTWGNSTELTQVILNVTVNALQATRPGGGGEVSVEGKRASNWIELTVRDNGRGMSPETIDRVFEPFFTERRGSADPGTGLGLCITHAIVESHGGRIHAESDGPGRGSRFIIRLPASDPAHDSVTGAPASSAKEKQEPETV